MTILLGMLGAVIGVMLFMTGAYFGREMCQPKKAEAETLSEEQQELRRQLIEEQNAFKDLMQYNADMAYTTSIEKGDA